MSESEELDELIESYTCPICDAMVEIHEFDEKGLLCDDCQEEHGVKWHREID